MCIRDSSYWATVSSDRRSQSDQDTNRFIVLGLSDTVNANKLAKLYFEGDTCKSDATYSADLIKENLCRCHTIRDNLVVAFHKESARLYDENMVCKHQVQWDDQLPVQVRLLNFSVAANHSDWESTGFICGF